MKLSDLSIKNLHIPFKHNFQHSSADRNTTESVLVTALCEDGNRALGEGCPRAYVTGESLSTAHDFFHTHRDDFLSITQLNELIDWIDHHRSVIDENPAAFCAVELALLNALSLNIGQSIEHTLSLPELEGEFQYSAVLGTSEPGRFRTQLERYLAIGFSDYKIKLFGKPKIDRSNLDVIRRYARTDIRVRFDANNLWSTTCDAIAYLQDLGFPIFALEEPLSVKDYDGSYKIYKELGAQIILDESFTKLADFEHIQREPEPWIINLRVSKMGGLLRSLSVAERAAECGVRIIVGAQVGETSILTRAALTVANAYRDIVLAQEGAFGTHLLERDITDSPIMFGARGILNAEQVSHP